MYNGYKWNDDNIMSSVQDFIKENGHFPKKEELIKDGKNDLVHAIQRSKGGLKKYQKLLGYEQYYNDEGFWSNDKTIEVLKEVIKYFEYFPTTTELINSSYSKVLIGVQRNGGINKFRRLLKYKELKHENGFWNDDTILNELIEFIRQFGFFPTILELKDNGYDDLAAVIDRHGGIYKFMFLLNYDLSQYKTYRAYKNSYVVLRGKNTEKILYEILYDYCLSKNLSIPTRNTKLSKGNIIEFVCTTNKKIGIDVTNTMCKPLIYRKWTKKDYYKYLDELWIVVVSDSFDDKDYIKWNIESPDNVYIMSIDKFIDELQIDLDESTKNKIDKYKKCTFHTRDKYKKEKQEADVVSAS